ncbi:hypothetical protein F5887DRAFT_924425 [Amanita rubescens]|nr:hypothetical protein F5887DRAFT_924425 [Amanita rubescens]
MVMTRRSGASSVNASSGARRGAMDTPETPERRKTQSPRSISPEVEMEATLESESERNHSESLQEQQPRPWDNYLPPSLHAEALRRGLYIRPTDTPDVIAPNGDHAHILISSDIEADPGAIVPSRNTVRAVSGNRSTHHQSSSPEIVSQQPVLPLTGTRLQHNLPRNRALRRRLSKPRKKTSEPSSSRSATSNTKPTRERLSAGKGEFHLHVYGFESTTVNINVNDGNGEKGRRKRANNKSDNST